MPILLNETVAKTAQEETAKDAMKEIVQEQLHIEKNPILLLYANQIRCKTLTEQTQDIDMWTLNIPNTMEVEWLCINDITGATFNWLTVEAYRNPVWKAQNTFTDLTSARIFDILHGQVHRRIVQLDSIENDRRLQPWLHLIDIHYIKEKGKPS